MMTDTAGAITVGVSTEGLPRPERGYAWLSAHLFFTDDSIYAEGCDRVLLESVQPLAEDWRQLGRRWFFIRYSEGGLHVRLRVFGPTPWLEEVARPAIEKAATESHRIERLTFVDYEPEVERYGGPHGVVMAEELFHQSSIAALELLRKIEPEDRSARFGKALLAMLVQLHTFFGDRDAATAVVDGYGTNYLRAQVPDAREQELWMEAFRSGFDRQADRLAQYVEVAWEALDQGEELTPELDRFRDAMQRHAAALRRLFEGGLLLVEGHAVAESLETKQRVVSSYLHMMNNRLGVTIREECYLSVLIQRALGCVVQQSLASNSASEE